MKKNKLYKEAIKQWGINSQLNMVVEECCELSKAVLKLLRQTNGSTISDVIEEMADVEIMIEQLYSILEQMGYNDVELAFMDRKQKKLNRLENMLFSGDK